MSTISKLAAAVVRANTNVHAVPLSASDDALAAAVKVETRALARLAATPATSGPSNARRQGRS